MKFTPTLLFYALLMVPVIAAVLGLMYNLEVDLSFAA